MYIVAVRIALINIPVCLPGLWTLTTPCLIVRGAEQSDIVLNPARVCMPHRVACKRWGASSN